MNQKQAQDRIRNLNYQLEIYNSLIIQAHNQIEKYHELIYHSQKEIRLIQNKFLK